MEANMGVISFAGILSQKPRVLKRKMAKDFQKTQISPFWENNASNSDEDDASGGSKQAPHPIK